ncbi:MAG: hypothetical protein KC427_05840 [Sulfurovum sp.]|uniref:hypothetical protein n=1 Tax=Sulfurovum sp. TaxID=1969726 RepID=UPI0028682B5C|nr:hypothetical protein [Sulfurovum sp.]MCO4845523.1 hypothetical protein [Sulfurovum sp.]
MYERKANIEEENLDWGNDLEKVDEKTQEVRHVLHPSTEHSKIVFHKKIKLSQVNIKRTILNILDDYSGVSLFIGILMLPYIIGFFVIAFILLTGGVPIDSFFSLKEEIFHFELWSIGSYIFITVGVIWLVITLFLQKR